MALFSRGDDVKGDKIERQIKNPQTYNENHFHGILPNDKPLYIMVVSKLTNEIKQAQDFLNIQHIYGNSMKEWKPFNDENIEQILEDFQQRTKFKFTNISYLDECEDTDDYLDELKKETIFISDGLTNCDFSKILDSTQDEIAGFIILINNLYNDNLIAISKECFKYKWKKYYKRINRHCLNIEICIDSKEVLFRRLTNFAKLKGIEFTKSSKHAALSQLYANSGADSIDVMGQNR